MARVQNGKVRPIMSDSSWLQCSVLGFTAVVNKELSAKYEILVARAPELIKVLPWGKDFEVDVFRKPDFTALEVLSFATGGEFRRYILVVKLPNSMEAFLPELM